MNCQQQIKAMITTLNIIFAISGFFNAISAFIFGTYVYYRNRKVRIYKYFYLSTLAFIIWALFYGFWQLSQSAQEALFWCRIFSIGSTLIPVFMFHFTCILLEKEKDLKGLLIFAYIQGIVYLLLDSTPLFIMSVEPTFGFSFWPKPGLFYHLYIIFDYIFLPATSAYLLFKNYMESTGEKKEQVKYVAILYLLPIIGGFTNFPYWYDIPIPPWGNFLAFLYPVITGYMISRYRFTDMRFMIGRLMVYLLSVFSVLFFAFLMIISIIRGSWESFLDVIFYLLILIISIFLYKLLFAFFEKIASAHFYKEIYAHKKEIDVLEKKMIAVLNLNELGSLISNSLLKIVYLNKLAIIFKDTQNSQYKINNSVGFKKEEISLLVADNFILNYLKKVKKSLLSEEITLKNYKETAEKNGASLFLPLLNGDDLTGLIILGRKITGDSYSKQDIELLDTLSNQISTVLENAKLYNQVQDLSENLQQKVDEQTRELKSAYEVEKKARQELELLDKSKNQFMLTTQHHLRTPLTSMKWSIGQILRQNKIDAKKTKELLQITELSIEKLIAMVNEFLDITQFQLGKDTISLSTSIEILPLIEEITSEIMSEAERKNIFLKVEKPLENYLILADRDKLKAALFNIVDNSVKYTEKGGVIIYIEKQNNNIRITVKDTGIGILPESAKNLFDNIFERGEIAKKVFATGRGIGLYIANQIIKSHKGKIWAESEGEGKGSTFIIELPAN